jgi:hypothetical protein
MNRSHTCEYDDKQQKSRTQLLKEQLAMLERRLQELESNPCKYKSLPLSRCQVLTCHPPSQLGVDRRLQHPFSWMWNRTTSIPLMVLHQCHHLSLDPYNYMT